MNVDLEAQESKYISLYCSDYIREAIDIADNLREKSKSTTDLNNQQLASNPATLQ